PHKEIQNGQEVIVNGPLGEKFLSALERQQALYLKSKEKQPELTPAEKWELLARKHQKGREQTERADKARPSERERSQRSRSRSTSLDQRQISASWNPQEQSPDDRFSNFRIALGKRLEFEMRLAFAEVWHERAVHHGDTYRFEVMDQSTGEERKISDLDVRRRAAARATRMSNGDHAIRNETIDADLSRHA